jgi:hypothetical protein
MELPPALIIKAALGLFLLLLLHVAVGLGVMAGLIYLSGKIMGLFP